MNNYGLLAIGGLVLALAGFAIGRAYPAHSYQQIGSYLYDTRTGKACSPFRESQQQADAANALDSSDPWASVDARVRATQHKNTADMIPACGSE